MKGSIVTYVLRLVVTLFLITAFVAAALAGVNAIADPLIQAHKAEKMQKAMEEVLPGAKDLASVDFTDATGMVNTVYASADGFVVEVAPSGFGGAISMMVGILPDGTVKGISVVSHTETAGLGSVAAAKTAVGEAFRGQFAGLSGELAVDKDGGDIDSITSATITSRAVVSGVNAALECVKNLG
jgi:electron transport complex protein RnfG